MCIFDNFYIPTIEWFDFMTDRYMLKILVLMVSMGLLRLKSVNGSNDLNGQKGLYDLRGLNGLFSMGLKDFMGLKDSMALRLYYYIAL